MPQNIQKKLFLSMPVVEWVWVGGCSAPVGRMVGRRLLSEQTGGAGKEVVD